MKRDRIERAAGRRHLSDGRGKIKGSSKRGATRWSRRNLRQAIRSGDDVDGADE